MDAERIAQFIAACHRVGEHRLVLCSSGNLSWRVDDDRALLTASRSWLGTLREDQIVLCRISDGALLNDVRPSAELGFHLGILRARPDVQVVLHFQTPFATALGCRTAPIDYDVMPEIPFYIGDVADVPYLAPGSPEIAEAVTEAAREHDMVQLRNHGTVTVAEDFDHAIQNAVFFELACEIIARAGEGSTRLPPHEGDALRNA